MLQAQVVLLEGQVVGVEQEAREDCKELAAQIKVGGGSVFDLWGSDKQT